MRMCVCVCVCVCDVLSSTDITEIKWLLDVEIEHQSLMFLILSKQSKTSVIFTNNQISIRVIEFAQNSLKKNGVFLHSTHQSGIADQQLCA